jgi:hypothetical protein
MRAASRSAGMILGRLGRMFGEHFLELHDFLGAALLGQALAHALERVGQPRSSTGFIR